MLHILQEYLICSFQQCQDKKEEQRGKLKERYKHLWKIFIHTCVSRPEETLEGVSAFEGQLEKVRWYD